MADKIKFALALVILAAGVAGFLPALRAGNDFARPRGSCWVALGIAVAWKTEPGQRFFTFANEAVVEAKKVVWPSRKETMQTTGAVFAFVVVMALFLYLTDKSLEWVLYDLVLGWKKS
jgi:preprotein translocase subunit SecE